MALTGVSIERSSSPSSANKDNETRPVPTLSWLGGGPEGGWSFSELLVHEAQQWAKFAEKNSPLLRQGLNENRQGDCLQLLNRYKTSRYSAPREGLAIGTGVLVAAGALEGELCGEWITQSFFPTRNTNVYVRLVSTAVGALVGGLVMVASNSYDKNLPPALRNQLLGKCMDEGALSVFEASNPTSTKSAEYSSVETTPELTLQHAATHFFVSDVQDSSAAAGEGAMGMVGFRVALPRLILKAVAHAL